MPSPKRQFKLSYIRLRRLIRNDHLVLTFLAIVVGCVTGWAIITFRELINLFHKIFFQAQPDSLMYQISSLPWWQVILVPTLGGLVVGVIVKKMMPDGRPHGVADVIEASSLHGGWLSSRVGLYAALVSALSIGSGASVGREGPAVHLGASLGGWVARRLHLSPALARTLLGCGASAAVACSFNAPIAGALFASEVVIGHYALKSFAPVVIASVAGTAITRTYFGDFPAFSIVNDVIVSFWEFPAFVGLGIVCGIVAILYMKMIILSQTLANRTPVPDWLKPAIAGLVLGCAGYYIPQIFGVGYSTTELALMAQYSFLVLAGLAVAKILATALCLGWGFGGGVFSPSLVIGAMIGGAYGIVATSLFPDFSSGSGAYSVIGMGALAAAVLGAPISTTLIIFEMTNDYALTMGVMLAVVIASEISDQFCSHSFFTLQLKQRGIDLRGGFEAEICRSIRVRQVMAHQTSTIKEDASLDELRWTLHDSVHGQVFVLNDEGGLCGTVNLATWAKVSFEDRENKQIKVSDVARPHPTILTRADTLEQALSIMDDTGEEHIAVVTDAISLKFSGCIHHRDALTAYNKAILNARHEVQGN